MEKLFRTKYGYFSNDTEEFVITTPVTPRPWANIITNGKYGLALSSVGSGYSWRNETSMNMINRWEQDLVRDDWGKYIYLRDDDKPLPSKEQEGLSFLDKKNFWSLAYQPCLKKPEFYECRHGIGYTTITSVNSAIRSKMTVFVPKEEPLEIWVLEVSNESRKKRNISVFTYLEWSLGKASDWHREFHRIFIETQYSKQLSSIFVNKRLWDLPDRNGLHWNRNWEFAGFHSSSVPAKSFTCDKEAFLGMFGNLKEPKALKDGRLNNEAGKHNDSIGALQVRLTLKPKEKKEIIFTMGAADNVASARAIIRKYKSIKTTKHELEKVKKTWSEHLEKCEVKTPDKGINLMCNTWLKYQSISARLWARTGYYQIGGAYGFRDQLQDSLIWLFLDPAYTRKQILLHAAHQFKDGTVYHWWHPTTNSGLRSRYSDDLLWLVFVTLEYLKETNDHSILNEKVKYVNGPNETLFKHLKAAVERVEARMSRRGLPLIIEGDWNDGLSAVGRKGKGESIWMGHFFYGILNDFANLCRERKLDNLARRYANRAQRLKENINKYGWDGKWYWRATCDDGTLLGSKHSKEGKIFLNAQSWSVINNTASMERARIAMRSAEKLLNRQYGPLLLYPAYTKPDSKIGYITRYAPGVRENGGIYTHAAAWYMQALCLMKKSAAAYKTLHRILPATRGMEPDVYKAEPYVTAGSVDGFDSPNFGRAGWTWYSGSSVWLFKTILEWILGVRATKQGLLVDPRIPKNWKKFTVKRHFRKATYLIEVSNPRGVNAGVRQLVVDNKKIKGNLIPVFHDGKLHKVKALVG
ncbi:MAG: glycosyl transferase family 36 [Candidatus Omnitrophota bacterium]